MKAVWYEDFGAADVLRHGDIDDPVVGPGEVLVRVKASGVNPVDVKRRQGGRGEMTDPRVIPHFDGAGAIEAVGEGVDAGRVGERVWIYEGQWQRALGTAAELVALPAANVSPLPEAASFAEGACLGIPALTAHRCVYGDGPVEGQTVLVTGGAGAVGSYAVQMAALGGANVIATTSGGAKAERAAELGASHVINYREENVAERVLELTDGAGVDRIVEVELGGNLEASVPALKVNGVIASYASQAAPEPVIPYYALLYKCATIRFEVVFLMPSTSKCKALGDISRWLEAGALKHPAIEEIPLAEAVRAHKMVEDGYYGKVVLNLEGAS